MDANGDPLIGVNILVKGTSKGTTTDFDGQFILDDVDDQAVLVFSYIGYKTQEVAIDGRTSLKVIMQDDAQTLDEVVVTALGIERDEKALGYAVQKVGGQEVSSAKGVDVATSLTGRVAGLNIKNSTEFNVAPSIELRGESPLIVIDGVATQFVSLRDIPADDIESIDVLKGATASALYGSRGGSGAIMVTTRSGMGEKGLHVSVNSSTMFEAGYLAIPKMQSEYGRTINTATNTYNRSGGGAWGPPLDGREVIQWDPISKTMKEMPFIARGKNNFKNFLQQGYILNNNINIRQTGEM